MFGFGSVFVRSVAPPLVTIVNDSNSNGSAIYRRLVAIIRGCNTTREIRLKGRTKGINHTIAGLPLVKGSLRGAVRQGRIGATGGLPKPIPTLMVATFITHHLLHFHRVLTYHHHKLVILASHCPRSRVPNTCSNAIFPPGIRNNHFIS